MSAQDDARDILAAIRGSNSTEAVAVIHPGEVPDVSRMTPDAAEKVRGAYHRQMKAHVEFILSKPASSLTADEQKTLMTEIGKWNREERR